MIDVFTPKWISPDFPFKSNQRLTKISILSLGCAAWLPGVMRTAELDSTVGCTPWSLTRQYYAYSGAWLHSVMHTAELDSAVWCTPRSFWEIRVTWLWGVMHTLELDSPKSDYYENVRFCFFEFVTSFNYVFIKKRPWTICDFLYNFPSNILRYHR